jgi:hypothetical protein
MERRRRLCACGVAVLGEWARGAVQGVRDCEGAELKASLGLGDRPAGAPAQLVFDTQRRQAWEKLNRL